MTVRLALLVVLSFFALPASAADWIVDTRESAISFSGTHLDDPFSGQFQDWSAYIGFDPNEPEAAKVHVVVKPGSAVTGNQLYDGTLKSADWFAVEQYPGAVFESSGFTALKPGHYVTEGTLTIKGKSVPLALKFKLDIKGDTGTMTASHVLDRVAVGLGAGSDPNGKWVSREITLDIRLEATER